jgi:hypothetical protein
LQEILANILTGKLGHANSDERKNIMERHLAAMKGPLACDRMIDIFEEIDSIQQKAPTPALKYRLRSRVWATRRRIKKRLKGFAADMSHNKSDFLRHRYPGVSKEDLQSRLAQFQQALGDRTEMNVEQIFHQFYRISAG